MWGGRPMSQWDIKGLETNFEGFRKDRYPALKISEAFEQFAVRQNFSRMPICPTTKSRLAYLQAETMAALTECIFSSTAQ